MPQVDLETLVCGGGGAGDGKVSCETLIATLPDPDPNLPPESITIPIDLFDLAAAVTYDRDDSTKESTNPKSHTHTANPTNPSPNQWRSNSQRYAAASTNLKANGPIIGLPNKIKHVTCTSSRHRTDTNSRIFPKKKPSGPVGADGSGRKSAVPEYEPSSPKVSCFGKVLSDRERERCRLAHSRRSRGSPGFWAGLAALFSCGGGGKEMAVEAVEETGYDDVSRGNILLRKRNIPLDDDEGDNGAAAPGLGGMKRFASGRRAASWGSDVEAEAGGHVAVDLSRRSLDEGNGMGPAAS